MAPRRFFTTPGELRAWFEKNHATRTELMVGLYKVASPSYRKVATWWVMGAKQEATQKKRLTLLIKDSRKDRKSAGYRNRDQ